MVSRQNLETNCLKFTTSIGAIMQTEQSQSYRNTPIPSESLPIYERVMTYLAQNNGISVQAYTNKIYFGKGKKRIVVLRHEVKQMTKEQAKNFFITSIYSKL